MEKPKKKNCKCNHLELHEQNCQPECECEDYNEACDIWEKYHNHVMKANNTCPIALLDKEFNQCQARQEIAKLEKRIQYQSDLLENGIHNLPSEEEITKLFKATMDNESSRNNGSKALNIHPYSTICSCGRCHTAYLLSKAIHERLGGV